MSIFQKKMGPVFIKENSEAPEYIEKMRVLSERAGGNLKKEIEKQMVLASFGESGEENIIFELKNSGIDMCVIRDIFLQYADMSAQIDFIIITRKVILVVECKNLIGNIEIDNGGNFIRTYELFGKWQKEGIYSPVTQNERHLRVLKEVRKESKGNLISKLLFENSFRESYKSIIVLANPKTYLNAKFAKKEIREKVIRADQLVALIKKLNSQSEKIPMSEKEMRDLAAFFLSKNMPRKSDYAKRYEELLDKVEKDTASNVTAAADMRPVGRVQGERVRETRERICPRCGGQMVLRVAKKGDNAGNRFYGCSNFPKCRYIENL